MRKALKILLLVSLYLGIHNGYIALWNTEEAQPQQVFPYRAELLPKNDLKALQNGIPIDDLRELGSLLEDFLS